jgi:DNA-binding Lrp family transcriptional regulator
VRAILKLNGTYDLEIALIARNVSEFDRMMTEIMGMIGDYTQESEILIITKYFRSSDLPHIVDDMEHSKKKITDHMEPDDNDMKILETMRSDARMALIDISKKTGMSADTVKYRLRRMEGDVIAGYQTPVNHEALGYDVHVVMMNVVGLDGEKERQLQTFFNRSSNILFAVKTIGKYNLLIYTCTKREQDLYSTMTGLRGLMPEKIRSYEYLQAFSKHKYIYAPDCMFRKPGVNR